MVLDLTVNTKIFDKITPIQWEEKIFYRAVQYKFPYQLDNLIKNVYPAKIARLKEMLYERPLDIPAGLDKEGILAYIDEHQNYLNDKILRLTDKYATCAKMLELRLAKAVPTTDEYEMHGTVYYIDYTNGNDANTGLGTAAGVAWKTINKYTTTTVRTAADIAYVRANQTHDCSGADIIFDEDGTADAYISIIGCGKVADGDSDPWEDDSAVRPIIDFGDAQYQMWLGGDDYWYLDRLDIAQSADTAGTLYVNGSVGSYIKDCIMRDCSAATGKYGLRVYASSNNFVIDNCSFLDNLTHNIYISSSFGIVKDCTLNGGVTTTANGLTVSASTVDVYNTTFGQTTAHATRDIYCGDSGAVNTINCLYNKTILDNESGTYIVSEDHNQVKGANVSYYTSGTVTKSTAVTRTGGASSSVLLAPSSSCGLYNALSITPFNSNDFQYYCNAVPSVITLYIRSYGAWSTYPTASTLYVEASYFSATSGATRSTAVSTAVLDDETTWQAFTVSFTPSQAGEVYIKVYLKAYEASMGCYVSNEINGIEYDFGGGIPTLQNEPSTRLNQPRIKRPRIGCAV